MPSRDEPAAAPPFLRGPPAMHAAFVDARDLTNDGNAAALLDDVVCLGHTHTMRETRQFRKRENCVFSIDIVLRFPQHPPIRNAGMEVGMLATIIMVLMHLLTALVLSFAVLAVLAAIILAVALCRAASDDDGVVSNDLEIDP